MFDFTHMKVINRINETKNKCNNIVVHMQKFRLDCQVLRPELWIGQNMIATSEKSGTLRHIASSLWL